MSIEELMAQGYTYQQAVDLMGQGMGQQQPSPSPNGQSVANMVNQYRTGHPGVMTVGSKSGGIAEGIAKGMSQGNATQSTPSGTPGSNYKADNTFTPQQEADRYVQSGADRRLITDPSQEMGGNAGMASALDRIVRSVIGTKIGGDTGSFGPGGLNDYQFGNSSTIDKLRGEAQASPQQQGGFSPQPSPEVAQRMSSNYMAPNPFGDGGENTNTPQAPQTPSMGNNMSSDFDQSMNEELKRRLMEKIYYETMGADIPMNRRSGGR